MIEISEDKYWKKMNYDDGKLYCSLLTINGKDDWRMISDKQEFVMLKDEIELKWMGEHGFNIFQTNSWFIEDDNLKYLNHSRYCWVIPVRGWYRGF
jgi:hypothetical protein